MRPLAHIAAGCLVALAVALAHAQSAYREDAIKAAFLYRFTTYVEWPADALGADVFTIKVLGAEGVKRELETLLRRYSVKGRPARVRELDPGEDLSRVQMLYVGPAYTGDLRALTERARAKAVLVVTDDPLGLEQGGAVNFLLIDRRVRFEVSTPAVQRAGLKVSADLLSVAANVRGAPAGPRSTCPTAEPC